MSDTVCLRKIPVNSTVCIRRITGTGEPARKIRDMGLVPGTLITVMGKAPLKDPVALRLEDFTLTLSQEEKVSPLLLSWNFRLTGFQL